MQDLSEDGRRIVEALVSAPVAWQSPLELSRSMGRDLEETTDILAILDANGWLSAWERDLDLVVTLSVAGASILGLKLVETGLDEVPRWSRRGDPEPPGLRASGVFRNERAAALELVVDPSTTAEEAVERAEEALLKAGSHPQNGNKVARYLPMPTILIGLGLTPWLRVVGSSRAGSSQRVAGSNSNSPAARPADHDLPTTSLLPATCYPLPASEMPATECPACRSQPLQPSMYCLYCDRWGLDHLLLDSSSKALESIAEPKDEAGRRELERQARKIRRKSRRLAQVDAERSTKHRRGA